MRTRKILALVTVALVIIAAIVEAAQSPLLAYRQPIYISASFAGIVGLTILLIQPLFLIGALPVANSRKAHMCLGVGLIIAVVIHVAGLWITSPPDVIDVFFFRSPTPFSVWGMLAFCAVFTAAVLAVIRRKIGLRLWRLGHTAAVFTVVMGTILHGWFVQGTMKPVTKALLSIAILLVFALALRQRRVWRLFPLVKHD